ncbi:ribbon-helix-helix domain-containing protein [Pararhizobium sp. LjRoot235]|uniref:ribbon-helix-helix domain-containing protein n=1 Tax=Pararhizobium sp. LjRoot235 TaxID=3342291 RepID=UPI003ECCE8A4
MIRKHSATLHGHRTSFSLEEPFWLELKTIADSRKIAFAQLIAEIDDARLAGSNLSSALRVYVLNWIKTHGHYT